MGTKGSASLNRIQLFGPIPSRAREAWSLPRFYPDEDLPNHNSTTGYYSDADSLLVNDGYSDNEEDGTHERSRVGRQEIISTRDEDDRTQEISPSEADSFETYENPVPHNYESTQVDVQVIHLYLN
ncbi:hypothetical protein BDZ94DRAFT_727936 [Collybia nuda]|uniref:Uncharacterized protein n=1 Tax=Collybia nuda TaxID=64659 RepID=A0A9P5Y765_9AGAR|nr:hypothetical protein BDZ94DRAFT_727936 [Collybia nuda]